jgi:hypothetical protein
MSIKKITVKCATLRIPTKYIGIFGRFVPGKLVLTDLPISVMIIDAEDQKEYECELVEVVQIRDYIPSVFSRLAEDMEPEQLEPILRERFKLESLNNNIAFYLYRHGKPVR